MQSVTQMLSPLWVKLRATSPEESNSYTSAQLCLTLPENTIKNHCTNKQECTRRKVHMFVQKDSPFLQFTVGVAAMVDVA